MMEWIPIFVFASVATAVWRLQIAADASLRKALLMRRLVQDGNAQGAVGDIRSGIYRLLVRLGSRLLPGTETERGRIRHRLDRAGFPDEDILEAYFGIRAASAMALGACFLILLAGWRGMSAQTVILAYGGLMLGYYVPAWGLGWRERKRTNRIFQELPDAIDILLVCMNAGLSFDRALQRVSSEMKFIAPILSGEFERYFFEVESGLPRQSALMNLADRNRVDALTSVVNVLVQSVRFGTDIGQALRVHADSLRMKRKQAAEERAAKVSTKLVFPTVLFIMPALMIVVLGPAGIRLLERIGEMAW